MSKKFNNQSKNIKVLGVSTIISIGYEQLELPSGSPIYDVPKLA